MRLLGCLLLALGACQPGTTDDPTDAPKVCDPVVEGVWTGSGSPFGMVMDTTVTFDAEACTFTTAEWNFMDIPMNHDSSMWGGTVDGDAVTAFGSTPFWDSCTGTLDQAGAHMAGTCADAAADGAWDLTLKEAAPAE